MMDRAPAAPQEASGEIELGGEGRAAEALTRTIEQYSPVGTDTLAIAAIAISRMFTDLINSLSSAPPGTNFFSVKPSSVLQRDPNKLFAAQVFSSALSRRPNETPTGC
jgi:hypothetical protein